MVSIYERLYHSASLVYIDMHEYIADMAETLLKTYLIDDSKIVLVKNLEPVQLDIKRSVSIGLIINELISNSLKYAYPGEKQGQLRISMNKKLNEIVLTVADDGIGLGPDFKLGNLSSLGLQLVSMITGQIDGNMTISGNKGTSIEIRFKI